MLSSFRLKHNTPGKIRPLEVLRGDKVTRVILIQKCTDPEHIEVINADPHTQLSIFHMSTFSVICSACVPTPPVPTQPLKNPDSPPDLNRYRDTTSPFFTHIISRAIQQTRRSLLRFGLLRSSIYCTFLSTREPVLCDRRMVFSCVISVHHNIGLSKIVV